MPAHTIQVGDTVSLACPPEDARVARVAGSYVFIEWPWRSPDPDSRSRWNGQVALPRDPRSREWLNTPWRVEPDSDLLEVGDACLVGIPPTPVVVQEVRTYDPPKDTGWIPRPTLGLAVVPLGETGDEAGYVVYVDGAEPISVA
ncbi:hypothetical protein [Yinghuangia seranimata]|uniref:hypothetical protein n=1 Tax=Yinghuangia seranimata TaxID=408067 RepID=UPI00248B7322|nr:hypothetical protein [Yinghuangia seranimata]MDI2132182.1 hypothetical protein [Yinghuangia seranimata]